MRFFFYILLLFGAMAPAMESGNVLERETTLKRMESRYTALFYAADFKGEAPALLAAADEFLAGLEREWAVILRKQKIQISLSKFRPSDPSFSRLRGPSWLFSGYDPQRSRIELRVTEPQRFDMRYVSQALHYHLVHYVLRFHADAPLPAFLREGLAQHYGRPVRTRDQLLVIWGLNRVDYLAPYLLDDRHFEQEADFFYAAALSRAFITWLDARAPLGETLFIQKYLRGKPWRAAIVEAGLPEPETLLAQFELEARQTYRLGSMVQTLDFWLILLSGLALLAMAFKVVAALRAALAEFTPLEGAAPAAVGIEPELFQGPVFGRTNQPGPPRKPEPAITGKAATSGKWDEDLDMAFDSMLRGEKSGQERQADGGGRDAVAASTKTPGPEAAKTEGELEDDIDDVFESWTRRD